MKTVLRGQGIWGRCANPDRHCRARHRTFREPIWEKAPYAKARLLMVRAGFGVASILTAPLRARFASSNATLRRFFAGSGWGWVHKSGKMKPKSRWFWLVAVQLALGSWAIHGVVPASNVRNCRPLLASRTNHACGHGTSHPELVSPRPRRTAPLDFT